LKTANRLWNICNQSKRKVKGKKMMTRTKKKVTKAIKIKRKLMRKVQVLG